MKPPTTGAQNGQRMNSFGGNGCQLAGNHATWRGRKSTSGTLKSTGSIGGKKGEKGGKLPMECPTMWAFSHPKWSIRERASLAIVGVLGGNRENLGGIQGE